MAAYAGLETFESYSNGDLNSLNGGTGWSGAWSGPTSIDVQSTVTRVAGSTRAIQVASGDVGAEPYLARTLSSGADSGEVYFSMRKAGGTSSVQDVFFKNGSTLAFYVRFDNAGAINLVGTTTQAIIASPAADTWYDINVVWVSSTVVKARWRNPGGSWSSFTSNVTLSASVSSITVINVGVQGGGTARTCYWDDISPTDPDITSAIKTIDGLAKASVKQVQGLAIASMKTRNGLA